MKILPTAKRRSRGPADGADNPSTTPATPAMTSDTTPSGICSASSYESGFSAYNVFDQISDIWFSSYGNHIPSWVAYEFDTPTAINKFGMLGGNNNVASPSEYKYQASLDGSWTDTIDLTPVINVTASSSTTYWDTIINSKRYKAYRIYMTDNGGDAGYMAVNELTLVESQS